MLTLMLMMTLARADVIHGRDDFGRDCALQTGPRLAVEIEGEWYDRPRDLARVAGPRRSVRTTGTLLAVTDDEPAEVELSSRAGGVEWFTLRLNSATGYAHACRLVPPDERGS